MVGSANYTGKSLTVNDDIFQDESNKDTENLNQKLQEGATVTGTSKNLKKSKKPPKLTQREELLRLVQHQKQLQRKILEVDFRKEENYNYDKVGGGGQKIFFTSETEEDRFVYGELPPPAVSLPPIPALLSLEEAPEELALSDVEESSEEEGDLTEEEGDLTDEGDDAPEED